MSKHSWRKFVLPYFVAILVLPPAVTEARAHQEGLSIPNGTILPVRLNAEINSKKAQSGQVITGRIMQDVPLPNGNKIPRGATVSGIVVASAPASQGQARITLRFDNLQIHEQKTPITTDLRAFASSLEVRLAGIPEVSPGYGTPWTWVTTRQVGGDEVYGTYGPVTDQTSQQVGTSVPDGVLLQVRAKPGSKCRGAMEGENPVQALWVFSADACGVYGDEALSIAHAGRSDPKGQIELVSNKGEVKLRKASGMLLRIER